MRRNASQVRNDAYASKRDYQTILLEETALLRGEGPGAVVLSDTAPLMYSKTDLNVVGAGLYLKPEIPVAITLTIEVGGKSTAVTKDL